MLLFAGVPGIAVLMGASGFAQTPASETNAANATTTQVGATPRDGFTLKGTEVVMTLHGVTTKVEHDVRIADGVRVQANGTILWRDGSKTSLGPNQLLAFDGQMHDVTLTADGIAPVSSVDSTPAVKPNMAATAADGITVVNNQAVMTRNGVTERIKDDVRLPNGTVVTPRGTITFGTGNVMTLQPGQVLDLNGVVHDAQSKRAVGRILDR
jgi:hypothetical protein